METRINILMNLRFKLPLVKKGTIILWSMKEKNSIKKAWFVNSPISEIKVKNASQNQWNMVLRSYIAKLSTVGTQKYIKPIPYPGKVYTLVDIWAYWYRYLWPYSLNGYKKRFI